MIFNLITILVVIVLCIIGLPLFLNNSVDEDEPELPDTATDDELVILFLLILS